MGARITLDRLRELLRYDPATGDFIRLVKRGCERVGNVAGTLSKAGYIYISIDGRFYRAHRLAWFYMTGEWADRDIDHKNRNRADNRWENLRLATRTQNNANRVAKSASGHKGVYFYPKRGRWLAKINAHGEQIYLGWHDTCDEARAAYARAAASLFGEFARAA